MRIAIDSAFYVASAFAFGVVPAAWLVAGVLTFDPIIRAVRSHGVDASGWRERLAQIAYSGGLPAWSCSASAPRSTSMVSIPASICTLAWMVPLFAVTFLVVHYLIAGGSHWFQGTPPREVWRDFFVRVIAAELSLMPLALAMVYGWVHHGVAQFLLLGGTGLLFNVAYRRAQIAQGKLQERVQELSTLNKVGQLISGSLERDTLLKNISTETLRLVGHQSRFMIGLVDPKRERVHHELFDEAGERYRELTAAIDAGLSGWVMAHRRALLLGDVQHEYRRYANSDTYNDPRFHSWLGVPLITYDEVIGVMSLQSEQRNSYSDDHLRVLTTIADQAAVAIENARLYELATVDGLTRLLVRRYFDQRLREEWQRALRYEADFSLGMFDLDNFKALNDTYGHQAGDQVLRAAAAVVRRNMRGPDLAGRYGGEEFAFLLPRTLLPEAVKVAERIRAEVEAMELRIGDASLRITASIGVAGHPVSGSVDVDDLLARADKALYEAKRRGKNRVVAAPELPRGAPASARAEVEEGVPV